MKLRHKMGAVATTALMTAGMLAAAASPAMAATSAPGCINRNVIQWYSVILTNNCPQGAGYYVKVIFDNAPDSSCFWLPAPGQRRVDGDRRYPFIDYNSTVLC